MDDITFVPALIYRDPKAALTWLGDAFGFEVTMAIDDPDGDPTMGHYEMGFAGGGRVMIGAEWNEWVRSPASSDGHTSAAIHVAVPSDIDGHCERARAAGARILTEPSDQFYGDRTYRCIDPEGHHWTFAMHVRDVTRAEAEEAFGGPIHAPDWQ